MSLYAVKTKPYMSWTPMGFLATQSGQKSVALLLAHLPLHLGARLAIIFSGEQMAIYTRMASITRINGSPERT